MTLGNKEKRSQALPRISAKSTAMASHRGDGKRFVVRADEKLTAFVKLESG
jgi:hypothetical protein